MSGPPFRFINLNLFMWSPHPTGVGFTPQNNFRFYYNSTKMSGTDIDALIGRHPKKLIKKEWGYEWKNNRESIIVWVIGNKLTDMDLINLRPSFFFYTININLTCIEMVNILIWIKAYFFLIKAQILSMPVASSSTLINIEYIFQKRSHMFAT